MKELHGRGVHDHSSSGVSEVRGAVKWTAVSNIANGLANGLITLVLASLLGPAEYGIVAIAILLVSFLVLIPGFGLETALIQRPMLESQNLNAVFWFNVIFGFVFAGLAILISGWWAVANGSSQLRLVTIVLAGSIPLHCLAIVQTALLKRTMEFRSLAIRDISATVTSGLIGIGSAIAGLGVWALVFQHLTRSIVSSVLVWRASTWRPNGGFTWCGMEPLIDFAWKTFVGQLGVFFQNNTDSIIMGVLFGPTAVGLYRFSSRLVEMILTFLPRAIQVVALPHFSKLHGDRKELRRVFLKGSHVSCLATLPLLALLAGAPQQILGAIGDKWLAAGLTLSLLTLVGVCKAIVLLVGPLLQALSKPGIHSFNTWAFAAVNGCGVLIVGHLTGEALPGNQASGIALMRVLIFCFGFVPLLLSQAHRIAGLSFTSVFVNLRGVLVAGFVTAGTIALGDRIGLYSMTQDPYTRLTIVVGITALVWFVSLRVLDREGFELIWLETNRLRHAFIRLVKLRNLNLF